MLLIDASNLFAVACTSHFGRTKEPLALATQRQVMFASYVAVTKMLPTGKNVMCYDSKGGYWRKEIFPYYKARRKKDKEKSTFDWERYYQNYNKIIDEFKQNLNAVNLQVQRAEADDIIAILALRYGRTEQVTIYGGDTDTLQLQEINPKIKQWSPYAKGYITPKKNDYSLFEHIVRGDDGDGIPNIYSSPDHFVIEGGKRQKAVYATKLAEWQKHGIENPQEFCTEPMLERFNENRKLVDLNLIPADISEAIVEAYESTRAPIGKMFSYAVANGMTGALDR